MLKEQDTFRCNELEELRHAPGTPGTKEPGAAREVEQRRVQERVALMRDRFDAQNAFSGDEQL